MLRRFFVGLSVSIFSYAATTVSITDDNILLVNGKPFFPLGVYFEVESKSMALRWLWRIAGSRL